MIMCFSAIMFHAVMLTDLNRNNENSMLVLFSVLCILVSLSTLWML